MDCSVQYIRNGARPKQEIRERGCRVDAAPRAERVHVNGIAPWTLNALHYCVENSELFTDCLYRFAKFPV